MIVKTMENRYPGHGNEMAGEDRRSIPDFFNVWR
jgi:hypothetical protein